VYPLLAVAEALQQGPDGAGILYVGGQGGMEAAIVAQTALSYQAVSVGQIRGAAPWTLLRSASRLWRGYRQAKAILAEWTVDAVLVTGGYVSVPVTVAAWRNRIPVIVYLPDLEPGWAVRFLSRFAERVAVSFDQVCRFFPAGKVWVSGYPVRAGLLHADRAAGYEALDLDPALKTLLVLGGSRGARSLNRALGAVLPDLLEQCQIVHISGELDWPWVCARRDELAPELRKRYRAFDYMHHDLIAAMAVADLAVARAGAATMGEFPAAGLPAILVPYPYAGQHQGINADFVVAHGAAVRIDDADLEEQLKPTVIRLLRDKSALEEMRQRAKALSRPDAAQRLAAELQRLAARRAAAKRGTRERESP
jgi:UDP-N-acetylglucosamine--N-acetylmuramyl-(pentapeptide) pyrophosphoryl-undecaprenol N-acetylglucosamine transferase